jgi:hypothetical protein
VIATSRDLKTRSNRALRLESSNKMSLAGNQTSLLPTLLNPQVPLALPSVLAG